ncbi:unnamed protein product [Protopolystoma xenopodis]|uniref:Uncharacterized protein n=1 Tax=Protopolystoma xenopodis TaxID=117903 RepID=A0A3S5ADB0_9PLAT|nr:unnamed protein product [Protopolystoma xenopodis]
MHSRRDSSRPDIPPRLTVSTASLRQFNTDTRALRNPNMNRDDFLCELNGSLDLVKVSSAPPTGDNE